MKKTLYRTFIVVVVCSIVILLLVKFYLENNLSIHDLPNLHYRQETLNRNEHVASNNVMTFDGIFPKRSPRELTKHLTNVENDLMASITEDLKKTRGELLKKVDAEEEWIFPYGDHIQIIDASEELYFEKVSSIENTVSAYTVDIYLDDLKIYVSDVLYDYCLNDCDLSETVQGHEYHVTCHLEPSRGWDSNNLTIIQYMETLPRSMTAKPGINVMKDIY